MQRVEQNLIVVVFALVLIAVILLLQWQPWLLLLPVAAIAVGYPTGRLSGTTVSLLAPEEHRYSCFPAFLINDV